MKDIGGFPTPGVPLLKDYQNNASFNVAQVNGINPKLGSGILRHTTGTGALTIDTSSYVNAIYAGDSYISYSSNTGSVTSYFSTVPLYNEFIPYNGATQDVNLNIYSLISSSTGMTSSSTDYPYSTTFTTSYLNIVYGTVYAYSMSGDLYDTYGDGFLYDSMATAQATIDYSTGAVDTTGYNSWSIDFISYNFYLDSYTTSISYNGSYFNNGVIASKDINSYAGYFSDSTTGHSATFCDGTYALNVASGNSYFYGEIGIGTAPTSCKLVVNYSTVWARLCDGGNIAGIFEDGTNIVNIATGTNSITTNGDIEITDFTKGIILTSPDATRWRLTVSDLGGAIFTSL